MCACAGYLFSNHCIYTKYSLARDEGQRFYIKSLVWGVPSTIICLIANWIAFNLPIWLSIPALVNISEGHSVVFTFLLTLVLAFIVAHAFNCTLSVERKNQLFADAMKSDDFDAVLLEAINNYELIAISMENRKIYVGYVYSTLEPKAKNSHLTILPVLSGYRERETLQFIISARYEAVIKSIREIDSVGASEMLQRYTLSVPRSRIVGLHLFNHDLHTEVHKQYAIEK